MRRKSARCAMAAGGKSPDWQQGLRLARLLRDHNTRLGRSECWGAGTLADQHSHGCGAVRLAASASLRRAAAALPRPALRSLQCCRGLPPGLEPCCAPPPGFGRTGRCPARGWRPHAKAHAAVVSRRHPYDARHGARQPSDFCLFTALVLLLSTGSSWQRFQVPMRGASGVTGHEAHASSCMGAHAAALATIQQQQSNA